MTNAESVFAFNPVPQAYDEVMGPLYFEDYALDTANRVAEWDPEDVLETACGTGRVTIHLRENIRDSARLTATDINPEMLAFAKEKFKAVPDIRWQLEDACQLSFAGNSFDAVVCQFGAMFFPDKQIGFSEAFRVLKKNGKFIFLVWDKIDFNPLGAAGRQILNRFFGGNPPENLRTAFSMTDRDVVAEMLANSGFGNIRSETVNKKCEISSAEKFADAFVNGSSVREAIAKARPEAIHALQMEICETVIRKFGDHPVRSTMQAIAFTAEKI